MRNNKIKRVTIHEDFFFFFGILKRLLELYFKDLHLLHKIERNLVFAHLGDALRQLYLDFRH